MSNNPDVRGIKESLHSVRGSLPAHVCLVAVSKFQPMESVMAAYEEGQRVFGESHVQELTVKYNALPKDIEWHFIGHLQTNKVKYIAPYISLIESVDSLKLLKEINRHAEKHGRVIDVLLELHVAEEETKSGFAPDDCRQLLESGEWRELKNVRICGIMTMASFVDDEQQIRNEFAQARRFFDEMKETYFNDADWFALKSWGMSSDYQLAVEQGCNMVRVGSTIFGSR